MTASTAFENPYMLKSIAELQRSVVLPSMSGSKARLAFHRLHSEMESKEERSNLEKFEDSNDSSTTSEREGASDAI